MVPLILASASPRRKELLEQANLSFQILTSQVEESFDPQLQPEEIVTELAYQKAKDVSNKVHPAYVLGCDTIVVLDGKILGKPANDKEAFQMLEMLSGRTHFVYTGVAIINPEREVKFFEKTEVEFWELTSEEIMSYILTGEPFDKAGAYGIQGIGSYLVKGIKGDYFSVVGLPLSRTLRELKALGYPLPLSPHR